MIFYKKPLNSIRNNKKRPNNILKKEPKKELETKHLKEWIMLWNCKNMAGEMYDFMSAVLISWKEKSLQKTVQKQMLPVSRQKA